MPPEPRRNFPVPLRVDVALPDGSVRVEYAVNISAGGLCLQVAEPLPDGVLLGLRFAVPGLGPGVQTNVIGARGRVAWTLRLPDPAPGPRFLETGIRFTQLAPGDRERLAAFASQPLDRRR